MTLDERIAALTEAEAKMSPEEWETDGDAIIEEAGNAEEDIAETIGANRKNNAAGIVALRNGAMKVISELRAERDLLLDSTIRDRTLTRPAGDYPEFMLQAFLDSGIAGTGAAKQAGALLRERTAERDAALARERGLREALEEIAGYDLEPGGRPGICPYGCDTPHIARAALAASPAAEPTHPKGT